MSLSSTLAPYAPALLAVVVTLIVLPVLGAIVNWMLWWDTPQRWEAFAAAHPAQASQIRILRAIFPHLRKALGYARDALAREYDPQSGRAALSALLALVVGLTVVLPLGVALMGCPKLPPVSGCTPMSQRCSPAGAPEVCSSSQRWEPAGDLSCTAAGGVCVVGDGGVAHCAPAQDGGAR